MTATPSSEPDAPRARLAPERLFLGFLYGLMTLLVIAQTLRFAESAGSTERHLTDFDAFHLVGTMIGRGALDAAYRAETMRAAEAAIGQDFLPFSYPPPFGLVLAPLGPMPLALAYLVFLGGSLAAYLLVLRRLAGPMQTPVLLTIFAPVLITIACGQNGFLVGALAGLACLGLMRGGGGVWLGLMIVKPHLAAGLALVSLATGRRRAALVAGLVAAAACALATLAFGTSVWRAFIEGAAEARAFLEGGSYPLFRMISPYAALRTLGVPAEGALAGQALVAAGAFAAILAASRSGAPQRQVLGIAVIAGLLVSPYAYDYDLPILGIGLALLLPDLARLAGASERIAILAASWIACGWGLAMSMWIVTIHGEAKRTSYLDPPALAAPFLILALALALRCVLRGRAAPALAVPQAAA